MPKQQTRYCRICGGRLARDNPSSNCGPCGKQASAAMAEPPDVPPEFWDTGPMPDALASWHIGQVIRAYRYHPHHGPRPLSQELVGGWLRLTQAQISRVEGGPASTDLSKLVPWAKTLKIPGHRLWFKLPGEREARLAAGRAPVVESQPSGVQGGERASGQEQESAARNSADDLLQLTAEWGETVDRRSFMGASAGIAASTIIPAQRLLAAVSHAAPPAEVRESDIDQVCSAARIFTGWDHTYGGGIVREAVTAQLQWSARLLDVKCPDRLRSPLFAAVGYLSAVCGFMAFDAYAHDDARRMFAFGLSCAEQSGEWHLRAKLLSHMARQAIWCSDADSGLTYTELALVRADRLTGTEQAMLHTARARALGKLGRTQETLTAIGIADEAFASDSDGSRVNPSWMAYYDHAQHQGDTGHALFDLAIHGDPQTTATARLTAAVRGHGDTYARSRAISGTKLATLTMAAGDPSEAVVIGQRALDDAGRLRSRRAADDLRELHRCAAVHAALPEVADLRERITALVGSA